MTTAIANSVIIKKALSLIYIGTRVFAYIDREKFRELFKYSYSVRGRYRVSRRSVEDLIKLARIGRELAQVYLEVIEWSGWKRTLMVKT